ncbi:hypothetical protein V1291_005298 [Nitrobacteraceae bacterium AZCC 1564]
MSREIVCPTAAGRGMSLKASRQQSPPHTTRMSRTSRGRPAICLPVGNTIGRLQPGVQRRGIQVQGAQTTNDAFNAQNYTPQQIMQLEWLKQQLPAPTLALLAQIGVPIAGQPNEWHEGDGEPDVRCGSVREDHGWDRLVRRHVWRRKEAMGLLDYFEEDAPLFGRVFGGANSSVQRSGVIVNLR